MTPLDTIGPYEELGLHPERIDPQEMILSRMDSVALTKLAEEGNLEDVQAIVLSLVGDNPQMEQYLADFQQTNDTAFVTELREAAAEEVRMVLDIPEASETEEMTPEDLIQHAKEFLYSSLDISEDEASNGVLTNFAKGIVDTLIIGNAQLALQVIETKGQVILEALKNIASWSGIKKVLSALGKSIWDLFTGSAYEKGKAVADLGLVATGLGAGISVGRKVLKTAMNSLDVPSAKNLDNLLLDDVAKLPPAERLEAVGVFLGRKEMSQAEQEAIILAHNTGSGLPDGSYSYTDLREKTKILREAGFMSGEIRTLFDKNICGKEFPEFPNIYQDPRFDYLAEYRDILGNITEADIVGEGMNAITLRHPHKSDKLIKIAKPGDTDKLDNELKNHIAFRDFFIQQRENASGDMKDFLSRIEIPEVVKFDRRTGIYEMDRVDGHNFRVLKTLELQPYLLQKLFPEGIDGISDYQIEAAIRKEGGYLFPKGTDEYLEMQGNQPAWKFIVNMESQSDKLYYGEFRKILNYFNSNGYIHGDGHWGNFMLGMDGKIYIIDFGRSKIPTE